MNNIKMTVIIPAYNEGGNIRKITERIYELLKDFTSFEILFVDDGSKDSTWTEIDIMTKKYDFVRGLKFSRNFGKEAAIYAGLSNARGECVVVIDADLQHPPEKILKMYSFWEDGYKIVECVKASRGREFKIKALAANVFYGIMSKLTGFNMKNSSDFKLLDRKAVEAILNFPEKNMFFRALSSWIGFKTKTIEFNVGTREEGKSKWSLWSLVKYALNNIVSFSGAPLQIITFFGVLSIILSFVMGVVSIYQSSENSVILTALFALSGIIMIGMGIIGGYLFNILDEVKGRPKYLIEEESNEFDKKTRR